MMMLLGLVASQCRIGYSTAIQLQAD